MRILHGEGDSVPQITAALRINRTYGYALLKEYEPKKRERSDEALRQKIQELCGEFPTNGYRRIRVWLYKRYQLRVNHKRVYRIMKELGLLTRSKGGTAKRKKQSGRIPVTGSNQHFQVDMTKIWCGRDGWGYLFAVIDAYDKEIVGYSFSRFCRTDELLSAVNQALEKRFPQGVKGRGLMIRSDNGCQMTSCRYVKALQDAGIKQERTGYNNPDADAYIERWFRTLKEETVWLQEYSSFLEAKKDIDHYIQFYNSERPHSALGYLSPKEFRQLFGAFQGCEIRSR
ncbi:IS3 family transposase [Thermoactinomyces sp. CICC 10523]|uniref:IS3 family transposase n=1 Tax=Thermoactinomyces sp. CICC 10523 TaxID=2767428 RepID=UPI00351C7C1C